MVKFWHRTLYHTACMLLFQGVSPGCRLFSTASVVLITWQLLQIAWLENLCCANESEWCIFFQEDPNFMGGELFYLCMISSLCTMFPDTDIVGKNWQWSRARKIGSVYFVFGLDFRSIFSRKLVMINDKYLSSNSFLIWNNAKIYCCNHFRCHIYQYLLIGEILLAGDLGGKRPFCIMMVTWLKYSLLIGQLSFFTVNKHMVLFIWWISLPRHVYLFDHCVFSLHFMLILW